MIRTARLVLREWRPEDLSPVATLNADPVVMQHFPATLTREDSDALATRIHAHFCEHRYGLWAVDVDGAFAGFTGLSWSTVSGARKLEVGWRLMERIGMRREREFDHPRDDLGRLRRHVLYAAER